MKLVFKAGKTSLMYKHQIESNVLIKEKIKTACCNYVGTLDKTKVTFSSEVLLKRMKLHVKSL